MPDEAPGAPQPSPLTYTAAINSDHSPPPYSTVPISSTQTSAPSSGRDQTSVAPSAGIMSTPYIYSGARTNCNTSRSVRIPVPTERVSVTRQSNGPVWSWGVTQAAVFTMFLCCPILSFIGLIFAIHAYVDFKAEDYRNSTEKLRIAKKYVIFSICFGIIMWLFFSGAHQIFL